MWKRVVQRVPTGNHEPSLDEVVDLIELQLELSTGNRSLRNRLIAAAAQIEESKGLVSQESLETLKHSIERIAQIEKILVDMGFETARDTSAS